MHHGYPAIGTVRLCKLKNPHFVHVEKKQKKIEPLTLLLWRSHLLTNILKQVEKQILEQNRIFLAIQD